MSTNSPCRLKLTLLSLKFIEELDLVCLFFALERSWELLPRSPPRELSGDPQR